MTAFYSVTFADSVRIRQKPGTTSPSRAALDSSHPSSQDRPTPEIDSTLQVLGSLRTSPGLTGFDMPSKRVTNTAGKAPAEKQENADRKAKKTRVAAAKNLRGKGQKGKTQPKSGAFVQESESEGSEPENSESDKSPAKSSPVAHDSDDSDNPKVTPVHEEPQDSEDSDRLEDFLPPPHAPAAKLPIKPAPSATKPPTKRLRSPGPLPPAPQKRQRKSASQPAPASAASSSDA